MQPNSTAPYGLGLAAALAVLLAGCQAAREVAVPSTLTAHTLACRSQASLAALHAAGAEFQRAADAELSSGRCRRFEQGHGVLDHQTGSSARFVDPASGQTYWIFH